MSCRFIDAYLLQARRWAQGDPTQCRAWARAFGGAQSGDANVLQSMFLGMNAHIHYDLAFVTLGSCRAAGDLDDLADTWRSVSRTGVPDVRHLDFLVINQIAWDAIPVIQDTVLGQFASAFQQQALEAGIFFFQFAMELPGGDMQSVSHRFFRRLAVTQAVQNSGARSVDNILA